MTRWLVRWCPWGGNTTGRRFWNANQALTLNRAAWPKLSFCLRVRCSSPSFPFLPPLPFNCFCFPLFLLSSPLTKKSLPPACSSTSLTPAVQEMERASLEEATDKGKGAGGRGRKGGRRKRAAVLTPAFCPDEGAEGRRRQAAKPGDEDVSRTSSRGSLLLSDYPTPRKATAALPQIWAKRHKNQPPFQSKSHLKLVCSPIHVLRLVLAPGFFKNPPLEELCH